MCGQLSTGKVVLWLFTFVLMVKYLDYGKIFGLTGNMLSKKKKSPFAYFDHWNTNHDTRTAYFLALFLGQLLTFLISVYMFMLGKKSSSCTPNSSPSPHSPFPPPQIITNIVSFFLSVYTYALKYTIKSCAVFLLSFSHTRLLSWLVYVCIYRPTHSEKFMHAPPPPPAHLNCADFNYPYRQLRKHQFAELFCQLRREQKNSFSTLIRASVEGRRFQASVPSKLITFTICAIE